MMRTFRLCSIILLLISMASQLNASSRGIVLAIGNGAYAQKPLDTPVNDATTFAIRMQQLGFEVTVKTDLNRSDLIGTLTNFGNRIQVMPSAVIFYYAGHGVQINGTNYLVPVDAHVSAPADIPSQTVTLDNLFSILARLPSVPKIVIMDACRSNPFATESLNQWVAGLAQPSNAPPNTLIAFATDPGNVAWDGVGTHSPYTRAILRAMDRSGLTSEEFFRAVRDDVAANTDQIQTPWETTSLFNPFWFWEPIYVSFRIGNADDDCVVLVNGAEITEWNSDGSNVKRAPLTVGNNAVIVKIYNQRSYTGGIPPFGHLPEGWTYGLDVFNSAGAVIQHLQDGEDRPADNGPRHGKMFTAATFTLTVDTVGTVAISNFQPHAWQH